MSFASRLGQILLRVLFPLGGVAIGGSMLFYGIHLLGASPEDSLGIWIVALSIVLIVVAVGSAVLFNTRRARDSANLYSPDAAIRRAREAQSDDDAE